MTCARRQKPYLVADARERAVIPFIEAAFEDYAFVVKQVLTADYHICRRGDEPIILAAIERKSHEDFAASFKDGRHRNISKMLDLRAETGCKLFYFVEGPAFRDPTHRIGGIPFGTILAAMTQMMVLDGIFVVQTENQAHTAKRLADFVRAFDTRAFNARSRGEQEGDIMPVPVALTERTDETDADAATGMWARLDGVSVTTGKTLTRAFTVAEIMTRATTDEINALKTDTGRPINKRAVQSLIGLRAGSLELAVQLVSGIRNITPAVAKLLLERTGGLSGLCAHTGLAAVRIPQKTRSVQFGKRAVRVQRILNWKDEASPIGPEVSPDPCVQV
jgi:ERCC4-type nuclease